MMSDRGIPRPIHLAADHPMSDELIVQLRVRVQARYYDRPEVIDAVARTIASRADAWG
jgi:DNA-directed RNA polymerase subunit L